MAEKTKSNNILIIGLFSFLITVVIAGSFIYITFNRVQDGNGKGITLTQTQEMGPVVPLGNEMIINIRSENGSEHYIKVNVTLEVIAPQKNEELARQEVTKRVPQFRDLIISILSSKTKEKIDEKEGKELVRSEIISAMNQHLIAGKIKSLFFEDFVIQ